MTVDLHPAEREAGLAERLAESPRQPGERRYAVKALWRTLQGEGFWAGRPAVFVRLAGCNLWSGHEADRQRDAARSEAACPTWCFAPETRVLAADYTQRPIGQIDVGDAVMAASVTTGGRVHLTEASVTCVQRRRAPLAALRFNTGTVAGTADHAVLCRPSRSRERVGFVPAQDAVGRSTFSLFDAAVPTVERTDEYWRGWLAGMAAGDGCFWTLRKRDRVHLVPYDRSSPTQTVERTYRRFRLALRDAHLVDDFAYHASRFGFGPFQYGVHKGTGFSAYQMRCVHLTRHAVAAAFEAFLSEAAPTFDYACGFLGGVYDAEGSQRARELHIHQRHESVRGQIRRALDQVGLPHRERPDRFSLYGQASFRFLALARPRAERKRTQFCGRDLVFCKGTLDAVEEADVEREVISLTTDVGTYVLGCGQVVKNCDTDFTREGAVKLAAGALADEVLRVAGPVRFVVLTGGEPLLQADAALVAALRQRGFFVAVETNGTQRLADAFGTPEAGPDWVVCSPKLPEAALRLEVCDELKLVVPDYRPEAYAAFAERVREHPVAGRLLWVQPEDGPRLAAATRRAVDLALADPRWRVSVQGHKALGVD